MLNVTVKKEIINEVGRLGYKQHRRLLDFTRALVITGPAGVQGGTGFEPGEGGSQEEARGLAKWSKSLTEEIPVEGKE